MKKLAFILVAALAVAGVASAQAVPWGPYAHSADQTKLVKVDGKLALINGMIGLSAGGKTYYTPMLTRLVGFVNGLNEGSSVKLEGYDYALTYAPGYSMLAVTKLTLNGKDYDLSNNGQGFGPGYGMYGMHGGPRGGMWGRW
jgi:hypothetical protein